MRKIESCKHPMFARRGCDFLDLEELTREKVHATKHYYRQLVTLLVDKIDNVFGSNCELPFARSSENQRILWIQTVVNNLGFDSVGIRRKSGFFHQDFETRFRWAIKSSQHQVKIHRKAVHTDHFDWLRTSEPRSRLAQSLVIRIPGRARRVMSVHAEACPIIEFLLDDLSGGFRHQTQRITGEIDQRLAIFTERQMKFVAEFANRILPIEFLREIFVDGEVH